MKKTVKVVGAGLAGSEAAYYLAARGVKVRLYDIKPERRTPAHHSADFGELVCSNSLKSNDVLGNACGLLKEECVPSLLGHRGGGRNARARRGRPCGGQDGVRGENHKSAQRTG